MLRRAARRFGRQWPYWVFAICLVGLMAGSTLAPSYEDCATNHHQPTADPEQGKPQPEVTLTFGNRMSIYMDCEGEFIHANEGVITALSTIFIALFTLALWRSTDRLWAAGEKQLRQAKIAADDQFLQMSIANNAAQDTADSAIKSAKLARQEFLSTHRPRLRVRKIYIANLKVGEPIKVTFEIANVGATNAVLDSAEVTLEVQRDKDDIAKAKIYGKPEPPYLGANRLEGPREIASGAHILREAKTDLLYRGEPRFNHEQMIVRGVVKYHDALGRKRETVFERFYRHESSSPGIHRFGREREPDPDYEYED